MDPLRLQKDLAPTGLVIPGMRERIREAERDADVEAFDELAQEVERLAGDVTDEQHEHWQRIYRKIKEEKYWLKKNGSIHKKSPDSDAHVLKFRRPKGGKRVQTAIYLGGAKMVVLTLFTLYSLRTGHPPKHLARQQEQERAAYEGN